MEDAPAWGAPVPDEALLSVDEHAPAAAAANAATSGAHSLRALIKGCFLLEGLVRRFILSGGRCAACSARHRGLFAPPFELHQFGGTGRPSCCMSHVIADRGLVPLTKPLFVSQVLPAIQPQMVMP